MVYSLRRYALTAVLNDWMVDYHLICNGKEFHSLAQATVKDFSYYDVRQSGMDNNSLSTERNDLPCVSETL